MIRVLLLTLCVFVNWKSMAQTPVYALSLPAPGLKDFSRPDSTFNALKEKMLQHRQHQNKAEEAVCLHQMGQVLFHLGNYTQAVDHLLKADQLFRITGRQELLAANLNALGTVYYYNQQAPKAWTEFREALGIYRQSNDSKGMADTYGLIGHLYEKQLQYDSAYQYQQAALSYAKAAKDPQVLARIHENIGSIFEDKSHFDSARHYFQLALDEYRQAGNNVDQIEVMNNLGDVWSKSGHYREGMVYARQAMEMALSAGEKYQLQSAYRDIAQNFNWLGQFDSAYIYLEKSRHLVQSIYAMENSNQISLLQTVYETEKKNAEIAQLNAAEKINRMLNIAIIAVLVLLALLAGLIINRQKLKMRNERAINDEKRKIYESQNELMESELKRQQLEEESLKQQLDTQSKELSSHILHLIQKNEVMEELKLGLTDISKDDKRDQKKQVRQLLQKINVSFSQDTYWEEFRLIFDKVHPSFMQAVQQRTPGLTPGELRLLALVKMNIDSGDMSKLLGVTVDSLRVLRYRLKKKLSLGQNESLSSFVHAV